LPLSRKWASVNILLVEDEIALASYLENGLRQNGHAVDSIPCGVVSGSCLGLSFVAMRWERSEMRSAAKRRSAFATST
jgi:hypothetical protein